MRISTILLRELWLRRSRLVSGLMAITLGIAVIVGIRSAATVSERAVRLELDNLGANILVLPQAVTVDDYYAADVDTPTFPESYVERIVTSTLPGVDNLAPRLARRVNVEGAEVILTGVLPASELAAKPIWQSSGLFGAELAAACAAGAPPPRAPREVDERLQRRPIDSLGTGEVLVGHDAATRLGLAVGQSVTVAGRAFTVARLLPPAGTIDDSRIDAHLHVVQQLLGTGPQLSAVEIMGCCSAISDGLLGRLRNILPDTRITTIQQIVSTQIETNRLMSRLSLALLVIIILIGAVSIANDMWANVQERRREIGTLVTLGAPRSSLYALFLGKALVLGVAGGVAGYALGSVSVMVLGPYLAGLDIPLRADYLAWSVLLATGIALAGSWYPVYRAARLDPAVILQEL